MKKSFISINPSFIIRNEKGCSFLIPKYSINNKNEYDSLEVPPFMGYIFAQLGQQPIDQDIKIISNELGIDSSIVKNFVLQLINNQESKEFKLNDSQSIVFPPSFLIETDYPLKTISFDSEDFDKKGEFEIKRPSMPFSANIMVTTACTTNCIYCYANRNLGVELTTDKMVKLIRELRDGGVVNIALTGGDIFARHDWPVIIKEAVDCGFAPFLSTKTPLSADDIKVFKSLNYDTFQFSLDSNDDKILSYMVAVQPEYLKKIEDMLNACSQLGVKVQIRTVLTSKNSSIDQVKSLYNFLCRFECIKEWDMTPAFFSGYKKEEYKELEVDNENLKAVYEFTKQENLKFPIRLNKIGKAGYRLKKYGDVEEFVCKNQICLGNVTSISILANGKCSVCEMLYDNPDYLLGDINLSTLKEIWNSKQAMDLYFPKQNEAEPACRECKVFDKCKGDYGKRVCYSDISKLGLTKGSPDPRCPMSKNFDVIL